MQSAGETQESIMLSEDARDAERALLATGTRPKNTAPLRVVEVREVGSGDVYGLTVDGEGCFFANGILVSNCDAFLYLIRALIPYYRPHFIPRELTDKEKVDKVAADWKAKVIRSQMKAARARARSGSALRDFMSGR
jgi:hypothetical protein